jgi:hypothetical protein
VIRRRRAEHATSAENPRERAVPWPVAFAGPRSRELPHRGATLNGDEAPPCMRWRGLALPRCPHRRLLGNRVLRGGPPHHTGKPIAQMPYVAWRLPRRPGKPIARMPCATRHHRCQVPAIRPGRPARAAFPRFPLGRIPSSVVRDFYCQSSQQHKGLSARTSRFFSHPQDICCLSSVHGRFPPGCAQACPQDLGIT